jgi:hypothetical protein
MVHAFKPAASHAHLPHCLGFAFPCVLRCAAACTQWADASALHAAVQGCHLQAFRQQQPMPVRTTCKAANTRARPPTQTPHVPPPSAPPPLVDRASTAHSCLRPAPGLPPVPYTPQQSPHTTTHRNSALPGLPHVPCTPQQSPHRATTTLEQCLTSSGCLAPLPSPQRPWAAHHMHACMRAHCGQSNGMLDRLCCATV